MYTLEPESKPAAPTAPTATTTPAPDNSAPVGSIDTSDVFGRAAAIANPSTPTYYGGSTGYPDNAQSAPAVNTSSSSQPAFPDANTWMQRAMENLGISGLDSNLKSLRERAIIQFGDPALAQEAGFGLDPQAGAFAKQNYLSGNSTLSRLDKQHDLARKQVINQLASHGLLRSGDLGYESGLADQAYGNNQYDARQNVLEQLQKYMQDYLDRKNALRQNVWQAYQSAYNNFAGNPQAGSSLYG